jgi:hypothetical protein
MAVTYKQVELGGIRLTMPVLHRVVYDARVDDAIPAMYQYSYKDHLVNAWLKENCKNPYYHSPGYDREKFIEFEDDEEATLFALRWA